MDDLGAISETAGAAAVEMAVAALIERGGKVQPCKNCSAPMIGAYCAACGQPSDTHRRSVLQLLHDFFKDVASFDSRILRTAWALLFRPGELSVAFREGRTQRYVPAVRLYLFVSLIFFLVLSAAGIAILQLQLVDQTQKIMVDRHGGVTIITNGISEYDTDFNVDKAGNVYTVGDDGKRIYISGMKANGLPTHSLAPVPHFFASENAYRGKLPADARTILDKIQRRIDAKTKKNQKVSWFATHIFQTLDALATDPAAINRPLTEWIPRALFVLLPIFALFLAAFYWRQRKNYFFVDHLVFSLNIHSFAFAVILLMAGLAQLLPGGIVGWIALVWIGVYLLIAMKRFYRQNWFWTGAKYASIVVLYPSVVLAPAFVGIILLALLRV